MSDLLFNTVSLQELIRRRISGIENRVDEMDNDYLLQTSVDDLMEYLISSYHLECPNLLEKEIVAEEDDADVPSPGIEFYTGDGKRYLKGTQITLYIPFEGDGDLFQLQASRFSYNPPRGTVHGNTLVLRVARADQDKNAFMNELNRELKNVKEHLSWTAQDVEKYNKSLGKIARSAVEKRRQKILRDKGLLESLGFKIKPRDGSSPTYVAPTRRRIPKPPPKPEKTPYTPEPVLGKDDYEHILKVLSNMVDVMERSPSAFVKMNEESLRTHFLVQLNGHYEGDASAETFNANGKTDILIKVDGKPIFIAECKFWRGQKSVTNALDQLLGYATWRDTKLALLIFNRDRNLTQVLAQIPDIVASHPCLKRDLKREPKTEFRYTFGHPHDQARELTMTIMVFDIPS